MKISQVLKDERKEYGFNQEELAEKILVSKKTISNWETGKTTPDLESLLRLSDLFNLSLDELIKGDKEIMVKIKKDTDTVTSNKKIALIIMSWTIIYGLILLAELFLDFPKVTDPFVNGLFILLGLAVGLYFFIKTKFEYMLEKIDINLILKGIFLLLIAIVVFSVSSFLNKLIDVTWQQNIIKVISTMLIALIGKSIFKKADN